MSFQSDFQALDADGSNHFDVSCVRRRSPDIKQLPIWLRAPLRRLVHSQAPIAIKLDSRKRMTFDWDTWPCLFLTRKFWQPYRTFDSCWLSCVRQWAALRPHGECAVIPTQHELIRAIVTVTVAETLAYRHGCEFEQLSVNARRHINTVASRQRENSSKKITLFHVVDLALARYDFDVFINKLAISQTHSNEITSRMRISFSFLHSVAAGDIEIFDFRSFVVELTGNLRKEIRGFLFLSWSQHLHLTLPVDHQLRFAIRSFVRSLPLPDTASLFNTPMVVHSPQLTAWLSLLRSSTHNYRWSALSKLVQLNTLRYASTSVSSMSSSPSSPSTSLPTCIHSQEDTRRRVSYAIMAIVLHLASESHRGLLEEIRYVAEAHTIQQEDRRLPTVFRDVLDFKFDSLTALSEVKPINCSSDNREYLRVESFNSEV